MGTQDEKKIKYMIEECGYSEEYAEDNFKNCDIYENMTLKELAKEFLISGFFGEDIMRVCDKNPSYIDVDSVAREELPGFVEHDGDIYRCD